jgi:hypothetical protein
MGAVPNTDSWQDFRYGAGPNVDGLFAQSNFGIVTKMGFWLMPMPEAFLSGTVTAPRYRDLDALVQEVSYLEDLGLTGMPQYGSPVAQASVGPNAAAMTSLMQNGWPSTEAVENSSRRRRLLPGPSSSIFTVRKKPFAPRGRPLSGVSAKLSPARSSRTANS